MQVCDVSPWYIETTPMLLARQLLPVIFFPIVEPRSHIQFNLGVVGGAFPDAKLFLLICTLGPAFDA